jgi:hypothetical protein
VGVPDRRRGVAVEPAQDQPAEDVTPAAHPVVRVRAQLLGQRRAARVHRSFLYRHPDLLAAALTHIANPPTAPSGTQASRNSLLADLANAAERNARLTHQITDLENALSRHLGRQVWRKTGLGAPDETARLEARVAQLEQEALDLRQQLEERDEELAAARAANRTLLAQVNR